MQLQFYYNGKRYHNILPTTSSITELNWWEIAQLAPDFRLVATSFRHYSSRTLTCNDTLWVSWCLLGPQ